MKLTKYLLGMLVSCAVATTANADTVMDHIGNSDGSNLDGSIGASQEFGGDFAAYDIIAVDNFTLDGTTSLSSISAVINGWNGYGGLAGISGYTVSIFSSLDAVGASIYGDVAAMSFDSATVSGDWMGAGDHISFDLGGLSLGAGSYYVGITATNDFSGNGQTGIMTSDLGDGLGAQGNANGGFGFGPYQETGSNYAYSLESGAIPAPGALALLGIAGITARRRRK